MTSSREYDPTKQVIGYPALSSDRENTYIGHPYPASSSYIDPYSTRSSSDPNRTLQFLVLGLFSIFLILVITSFIIWLILLPRLPEFKFQSATIPPLDTSDDTESPLWEVSFSVFNPNKRMRISYEKIVIILYYDQQSLGQVVIPGFDQNKKTGLALSVTFQELGDTVPGIIEQEWHHGFVTLNVEMSSWIQYRSGVLSTKSHLMRVTCMDVRVGFNASTGVGSYLGRSENCKVTSD